MWEKFGDFCKSKWHIYRPLRFNRLGGHVYSWILHVTYSTNLSELTKRRTSTMPVHLSVCMTTKERESNARIFVTLFLSCPYPCGDDTILRKNPTNALNMLTSYQTVTLVHVSALMGPSSGCKGTFCEQGHQNTCPGANIRLKRGLFYVTQQFDNRYVTHNRYFGHPAHKMYQYSLRKAP